MTKTHGFRNLNNHNRSCYFIAFEEYIRFLEQNPDLTEKIPINNLCMKQEDDDFRLYYKLLGINPADYRYIKISDFPLSVRSQNCLKIAKINTLEDFLRLSDEELIKLRNLGQKSFDEIKYKILEQNDLLNADFILKDNISIPYYKQYNLVPEDYWHIKISDFPLSVRSQNCLKIAKINTLEDFLRLSDEELMKLRNLGQKSFEEIKYTLLEKLSMELISQNNISSKLEQKQNISYNLFEKYDRIPHYRKEKNLEPYITAYEYKLKKQIITTTYWQSLIQKCKKISELHTVFEHNFEIEQHIQLLPFLEWISFDLNKIIQNWFESYFKDKRIALIIKSRAKGKTLQECGDLLGITRERVRQIEKKFIKQFNLFINSNPIIMMLYAERNGDAIITPTEIEMEIYDYAVELIYLLKITTKKHYIYDKNLDVFIVGPESISNKVQQFVDSLPDIVSSDKIKKLIEYATKENDLSEELLYKMIEDQFTITENIYHRSRLKLSIIYEYVLKKYYPSGIKVYNKKEIEAFKDYIKLDYGDINLPEDNRAISIRIANLAVLCNRGTYIDESYIDINKNLLKKINEYIDSCEEENVYYNDIFDNFKEELLLYTNIDNKYFLHGVLKKRFSGKYIFKKDYLVHTVYPGRNNQDYIKERHHLAVRIEEYFLNSVNEISINEILINIPGLYGAKRKYILNYLRMSEWCEETDKEYFVYINENPVESLERVNDYYGYKDKTRIYKEFRNISQENFELAIRSDYKVTDLLWESKYDEFVEICLGNGIIKAGALLFIPFKNNQLINLFYNKKLREIINKIKDWVEDLSLDQDSKESSIEDILTFFWRN